MDARDQKLALVPITDVVDAAQQLLVYETAAAKMLKISIREFRHLVEKSVIPYRLHRGRSRRLFFVEDLREYARNLEPHLSEKEQA